MSVDEVQLGVRGLIQQAEADGRWDRAVDETRAILCCLRPDLDAKQILSTVQSAYDSRAGASAMPGALKRSPQTEGQRSFVRGFVSAARAARRYDNDLAMRDAGMPGGFV